jgi:hypothetical protein
MLRRIKDAAIRRPSAVSVSAMQRLRWAEQLSNGPVIQVGMAMLTGLLKRWYRRPPVVRELADLRDLQYRIVDEIRQGRDQLEWLRLTQRLYVVDFAIRQDPRYVDPKRLSLYDHSACSQNGEDGVIREVFRRVGTTDRTFVEVGAGDGKENNTAFLRAQGWTGFWIDGDPAFVQVVKKSRYDEGGRLKWSVSMVTRENAASLLGRMGVPAEFDLLSIDIDQNTYYIWDGLREYRPRVVVVEYNASLPADPDRKVDYGPDRVWDFTHNFGASLKAFEKLGRELGYSLVGCDLTGINAFFVRDDLVEDHFAGPFTAENHYEPPRYVLFGRRGHANGMLDRARPVESAAEDAPRPAANDFGGGAVHDPGGAFRAQPRPHRPPAGTHQAQRPAERDDP